LRAQFGLTARANRKTHGGSSYDPVTNYNFPSTFAALALV